MLIGDRRISVSKRSPCTVDPAMVRAQVDRIVAHPLFSNSKRYPAFLQCVTRHALSGGGENLRERSLGVEVLGRAPDYDTEADPVVPVTFSEMRRRLSQYYSDPEHAGELRIHLQPGSYLPDFRTADSEVVAHPDLQPLTVSETAVHPEFRSKKWNRRKLLAADVRSNPKYMEAALSLAPKGWDQKNIEIVVETKVVKDTQGVPSPLAVHVW